MITRNLLTLTIIAALPIAATAENISGAMYTAPAYYDTNHPAPTTKADAPFGRVNIDTDDQSHVATTAYVKGAYNSAIAAVNRLNAALRFQNSDEGSGIDNEVFGASSFVSGLSDGRMMSASDSLVTADGVAAGILSQRVEIYTTWDTNDTTDVAFKTVLPDD